MEKSNSSINLTKMVTFLANERTILANLRTSLVVLATGIAFQELFL